MPGRIAFHRRAFLRGAGALVGLPALESLGAPAEPRPRRLAVLYVPNGVNVGAWTATLSELEPLRTDFSVFTGLTHDSATPGDDGAGDHARAAATFLTGARPLKTGGADIRAGVSFDQVAANAIGATTRCPSLQLATEGVRAAGRCDSGYSCAYEYNLSWKTPTLPLPGEHDPRQVFERLFGAGPLAAEAPSASARRELQKSVLDFVLADARALERRLAAPDREKLDQYFGALREVERRIAAAERSHAASSVPAPSGVPASFREHVRIMIDLVALAFEADVTRVVVFMLGHEGSNRAFPEISIPEAHHQLSHHQGDAEKLQKIARIDRFHLNQLAYLIERLKGIRDGAATLLDQSAVLYGSGISEGNQHLHSDLPILLAGRAGGTLTPGRHIRVPQGTPLCNLFVALLNRMGVRLNGFGDSTGAANGL